MTLGGLFNTIKDGTKPSNKAPWPTQLDATLWLWQTATPRIWQEIYDTGNNYTDVISSPGVWGLTGISYTDPEGDPDKTFAGWTMGDGGRYEANFIIPASFGYRLWSAMMLPLAQIRTILDRAAVRYDATQASTDELNRLARWVDIDPVAARYLDMSMLRRAINAARGLETERGTDTSSAALSYIFNAPVTIQWHPSATLTRIVVVYAHITSGQRFFIRRHLPPHINAELWTYIGHADYTDLAYTAKYADASGNVPEENAIYAMTSQLTETVELI